jgi:NAD(P)-dependent dehydrogenase (short-subunit alcohol dehydrogenase family)
MDSERKVALVTGGAQGIGRAICERFLADGWRVALVDIDTEACAEARAAHPAAGLLCVEGDVAEAKVIADAVAGTLAAFGRLDAVISNAGIGAGGSVETLPLEQWNRVIATNLTAAFLLAKHSAEALRRTLGSMVLIASTRALQSEANTEAYSASKGGLVALAHALAVSLGHSIRVNAVSPGWIETGPWKKGAARSEPHHSDADRLQHPVGRVGTPGDVAALVAFLVSESAGFITGQNYVVDGGMTRKMIYVPD